MVRGAAREGEHVIGVTVEEASRRLGQRNVIAELWRLLRSTHVLDLK